MTTREFTPMTSTEQMTARSTNAASSTTAQQMDNAYLPSPDLSISFANVGELYVTIAGPIGAGKTTLAEELGKRLNLPVYKELDGDKVHKRLLNKFYANMKENAFGLEIYLLSKRFAQQQRIGWSGKGAVQDRSIYEDGIFVEMLTDMEMMTEDEYLIYTEAVSTFEKSMVKPRVLIYLRVSPEKCMERIRKRIEEGEGKRDFEKGITLDYMTTLCKKYENFVKRESGRFNIVVIDWNEFGKGEEVLAAIEIALKKTCNAVFIERDENGKYSSKLSEEF